MIFGPEHTERCAGAILAHGHRLGDKGSLKKGHVLAAGDIALLLDAGIAEITVARLEPGEVDENEGAQAIAAAAAGSMIRTGIAATGRVNMYATLSGLLVYDPDRLHAVNGIAEAATIAAAPPFARLNKGQLAATAKIIPLGLASAIVEQCAKAAGDVGALFTMAPFQPLRIGLLQTRLPFSTDKILDKTTAVLGRRATSLGSSIGNEYRVDHTVEAVSEGLTRLLDEGCELILVAGASATTDRRDTVPAAVGEIGGTVEHFGMPVDPGNLSILCRCRGVPILGLPGSARSPRRGGNDWVLERLAASLPVEAKDIMALGAGGLLKEIPSRPLPREQAAPANSTTRANGGKSGRVAGILLAAGQSRRMGPQNKLLAEIDGQPMVARAAAALLDAACAPVIVVLGHQAEAIRGALDGLDVAYVDNPDFADGLATSLAAGIAAMPDDAAGAVIGLGDMPLVTERHIRTLISAADDLGGDAICVPVWRGKRGNPVLWGHAYFGELTMLEGDVGAKHLLGDHADAVIEVAMQDGAIFRDVDTPGDLAEIS